MLKVAEDPANNGRVTDEALALDGIKHQAIVSLLDADIDVSGHAAILISYAGPKVNTDKSVEGQGRTLASRLTGGPVGAELAGGTAVPGASVAPPDAAQPARASRVAAAQPASSRGR